MTATHFNAQQEPLANELARCEVLAAPLAVGILRQLARNIATRHESGRLHLRISAEMVSYNSQSGFAELFDSSEEPRSFGGTDCDDEFCPPELQQSGSVFLTVNFATAQHALQAAGLSGVDPRRVDIYQLGTLLCRLLTGQCVSDFLSRPRVAAKVSPELRDLIERALGNDSQRALRSAEELLRALESLDAAVTQALPNAQSGSTRDITKPDTTPSFADARKADTDIGRPAPLLTDVAALPFRKLGHYEIVGRLGRGGMGDVFKGYERRLDRYVAIKVLPTEFARQDEMVKRFNAEASAAAKLVHPNTVEIFFIGDDKISGAEGEQPSTVHFFAMRFVEGESLAELLARRNCLSVDESLAIIEQTLAGLDAAHRLGLVHRDIKPGNILIDRERQRVLLADFGLVKSLQAAASMTASGVIVGTADYMAPEQGCGATVDARADLYAIGVVLYQMLSGQLPFKADSVTGMIFQHVYETPRSLHDVASDVPEALTAIVAKLMAKSPDARYQSVGELLDELRAFHQGLPLPSGVDRDGVPTPTSPRRPSAAAVDAPGAVDRPRTTIIPVPRFADEPVLPVSLTRLATPDHWQRIRLAIRDFFLVQAEELIQQIQTTEQQVDAAITDYEQRHASLKAAVRDAEAVVQDLEAQQDAWRCANAAAEQRASDAQDDGTARTALGEKVRGERVLAELAGQLKLQQAPLDEMRHKMSQVTATLERLCSQRGVMNARLKVARAQIRLAGGDVKAHHGRRRVLTIRWGNVSLLVGVLVILGAGTTMLTDVMFQSGQGTTGQTLSGQNAINMQVDEKMGTSGTLANTNSAKERYQSAVAGQMRKVYTPSDVYLDPPNVLGLPLSGCERPVVDLAVSPTGSHVAAATGDRTVFVWEAESGRLLHRLTENLREVNTIAFNSAGTVLATGESNIALESTVKFWDPHTGGFLGGLPGESSSTRRLAFQPKGSLMAVAYSFKKDGNITVWNYETRTAYWTIPTGREQIAQIAFSPDGLRLATVSTQNEIQVWDLAERKLLKSWLAYKGVGSTSLRPFFLSDGTGLLAASGDGSIIHWDIRTGVILSQTMALPPKSSTVTWSDDGRWLAASNGQQIMILDPHSGLARTILPGHQTTALAFSPTGDRLFSAGGPPYVARWETNAPVLVGRGPSMEVTAGPLRALSRDKPFGLFHVGTAIGLWNYERRSPLTVLKSDSISDTAGSVAAFSPDSRRVAMLDGKGRLQAWDVVSGDRFADLRIRESAGNVTARQLEFSTDADLVWAATTGGLWRCDLRRTTAERWLEWPIGTDVVSLSPGSSIAVAATNQSRMQLWEVESRQQVFRDDDYPGLFTSFAFTSDGRQLLGIDKDGTFYHWNLERRELLGRFDFGSSYYNGSPAMTFLPDQRHVVALDPRSPTVRVIDLERRQEVLRLRASQTEGSAAQASTGLWLPSMKQLQVTSDGRFVLTSSETPGRLAFWDLLLHRHIGATRP